MEHVYDDGGRKAAGFSGKTGDCVVRAIAIATEKPYQEVYDALNGLRDGMRQTKRIRGSNARTGTARPIYDRYLKSLGWSWVPTMTIGSGCKVHLHDGELPSGRLICRLSKHLCAVLDGVIHDTFDPQREIHTLVSGPDGIGVPTGISRRCVYGYYIKN